MSLTQDDLLQIEAIFDKKLDPLFGKLEALENDIKEIYEMLSELQKATTVDRDFRKLSLEEKLLRVNAELIATAQQAGIQLPR